MIEWPDPTPEMIATLEFKAVWDCIKSWDISVPAIYGRYCYCAATGNHVRAILDALAKAKEAPSRAPLPDERRLIDGVWHVWCGQGWIAECYSDNVTWPVQL